MARVERGPSDILAAMELSEVRIQRFRSVEDLTFPVKRATLLVGANGCGKTNVYKALELLQSAAEGRLGETFARNGGFESALFFGATERSIVLGLSVDEFDYDLELHPNTERLNWSPFAMDPRVRKETIRMRTNGRSKIVLSRTLGTCTALNEHGESVVFRLQFDPNESVLSQLAEPRTFPIIDDFRRKLLNWRFYHTFRTDAESPLRMPQPARRSWTLDSDGSNVAAVLTTINWHSGHGKTVSDAIAAAFRGATLAIDESSAFDLGILESGRRTSAQELSDGTLRYLCLLAALLPPKPPQLLVFNEPETSLHGDLLPHLGDLIALAAIHSQVLVTTHASALAERVQSATGCKAIELERVGLATVRQNRTKASPGAKLYFIADDE